MLSQVRLRGQRSCDVRATRAISIGRIPCMSGTQLLDMSGGGVNVRHMSKMIQIRNVPDEMHRELKVRAALAGMSLSDYIKKELGFVSGKKSMEEIDARVKARGPSKLSSADWVEIIREGRGEL